MLISNWSILNFRKYKNKSAEVVLRDPDYFFWANNTRAFHRRGFPEAGGLAAKTRDIKIPKPADEGWGVVYDFVRSREMRTFDPILQNRRFEYGKLV